LFIDEIEPFFGRHFSMCPCTKRCSSSFDLGPLTPKIYSPKFAQNRLCQLVWQIDNNNNNNNNKVWAYQGVFGDGRFNGTMQNVVGPTLVAMVMKFGLGVEI